MKLFTKLSSSFSLTVGIGTFSNPTQFTYRGYGDTTFCASTSPNVFPSPFGSMSSVAFAGQTVEAIWDGYDAQLGSGIYIRGFASDPGQSWLRRAVINGVVGIPGDSHWATYTFSSGAAQWFWFGPGANNNLWILPASGTVTVILEKS